MAKERSFLHKYMTNFLQIVPIFTATFSGVFADVDALGDESGKH